MRQVKERILEFFHDVLARRLLPDVRLLWPRGRQLQEILQRAYFDLRRARAAQANSQTPWTPAVSLFFQLDRALQLIREEGVEQVWARHHRTAESVRQGVLGLGLELFADEAVRSDTVTAILPPEGVAADELRKVARADFETVFAGGQRELGGKIFRCGHLGYCTEDDVRITLEAIEGALAQLGHAVPARG